MTSIIILIVQLVLVCSSAYYGYMADIVMEKLSSSAPIADKLRVLSEYNVLYSLENNVENTATIIFIAVLIRNAIKEKTTRIDELSLYLPMFIYFALSFI